MELNQKISRLLFTICLLAVSQFTHAQLEQGNIVLGGNFGASYRSITGPKILTIRVQPKFSYMVIERFSLGITTPYGLERQRINGENFSISEIAVGPSFRYYLPIKKFAVFPEIEFMQGREKEENIFISNISDGITDFRRVVGGLGFSYFPSTKVALEATLVYQQTWIKVVDFYSVNDRSIFLTIGFQFYLATNKN